jgi:hypothetical protein
MQMLGIAQPNQLKSLKRLQEYIERELAGFPPAGTLDQYAGSI